MIKILAIDDKQDNLITISAILKNILPHCVIITAQSGEEGIRRAQSESPDTILLDIRMPQMDGYRVCAALKSDQNTRHIPIIMLTAHDTDTRSRIKGLELGADAFLTKPIDEAEFVAQVKVMLRIKKAEDRLRREKILLEETVQDRTRQLSEKEERYRLLFNKANDAVFVYYLTPAGRPGLFIEVNEVVCQKLGYTREELWQMSPLDIVDPQLPGNERNSLMERLFAEKHIMFETVLVAQNGRKLPVEINTHLFDLQGKPTVLSMARDISERKQAELEKERIRAQLFQAQKMEAIGVLAGGIAHDFNNILTTIQGYTSLLMLEIMEPDPLYMDLKQICSATCSAANLTRQLLLFSRKQHMSPSPLNINTTIHNLFSMMDRLIGEDITINLDLEPDLRTVWADEGNIQQVIMNIVVNARDAMPGGGRITIRTENLDLRSLPADFDLPPGKGICLTISDSGTGMDQKTVQKIFEPFFTTKEAGQGTGLGLSVAYGIVKQHQGDIQVESEPGQGSSFKIYLPAGSGKLPVHKEGMAVSVEELQGSGERILLVEDEEGVRNFGLRVLRDHGYVVFDTANAKEAIDVFEAEEGNIQMIFSDVVLPDLTGLELIDHLLGRNPDLGVLLSSGYTDQKSQWPLIQKRGYEFLPKPYSMADLLKTIKKTIQHPV